MLERHDSPVWDSEDTASLRTFLEETRAGTRLLPALAFSIPGLLGAGDTNSILIRNGEVRGAQSMVEALLTLASQPASTPKADPNPYPSLTDDEAWADGQKIETTKP